MSEPSEGNGRGTPPEGEEQAPEGAGVLANLPRTRPQRASARRAAARRADTGGQEDGTSANGNGRSPRAAPRKPAAKRSSGAGSARPAASKTKTAKTPKSARAKPARARRGREADTVPRQGYESVEERATGPVAPPGGTELLGTAAEIVSEVAKAGLSGGERVVRDLLSRLGR